MNNNRNSRMAGRPLPNHLRQPKPEDHPVVASLRHLLSGADQKTKASAIHAMHYIADYIDLNMKDIGATSREHEKHVKTWTNGLREILKHI